MKKKFFREKAKSAEEGKSFGIKEENFRIAEVFEFVKFEELRD
jgi:hypothetical protein